MAFELIYTSNPTGIRAGSSGFCTVAHTNSMPKPLITILEGLSGYNPLYPHYDPQAWNNPVSYAHCIRDNYHILSRVCFNGTDYTQRSNKLASHIVIDEMEVCTLQGGPSSVFFVDGIFKDANWQIKPEIYEKPLILPQMSLKGARCQTWEKVTGDAGWGGVLAENYLSKPDKNTYIVYAPEQHIEILKLIHEALALLPEAVRWNVSFNTYCTNIPAGITYLWRCCLVGSDMIAKARHLGTDVIIDISQPLPRATGNELVAFARTGINPIPISEKEEEHIQLKSPNNKINSNIPANKSQQSITFEKGTERNISKNIIIEPEQSDVNNMKNHPFIILLGIILIISNLLLFILYQMQINKMKDVVEKVDFKIGTVNNDIKDLDSKISNVNKDLDSKISNVNKDLDSKINVLSTNLAKIEENKDSQKKNLNNPATDEKSKEQSSEKKQKNVPENRPTATSQQQNETSNNSSILPLKIESDTWHYMEHLIKDNKCEIKVPINKIDKLKISVNEHDQKVNYDKANNKVSLKLDNNNTTQLSGWCELLFELKDNNLRIKIDKGSLKIFLAEKLCLIIYTDQETISYPLYFSDQSTITKEDIIFQQSLNKFTINCSTLPNKTELKLKMKDIELKGKEVKLIRRNNKQQGTDFIFIESNNQYSKSILNNDPQLLLYIDNKERLSIDFSAINKK